MKRRSMVFPGVFLFFCVLAAPVFADVLPRTTTATRDIMLVEEFEEKEEQTAVASPVWTGMDGEEQAARLGVEEMHKTDFSVSLSSGKSAQGDVYEIGDKIEFTFTSDKDCYVTLLDFTPSGKIYVLFPNKWVSNNFVKAGESVVVPAAGQQFAMKLGGPAGVDIVKAIATNVETKILDPDSTFAGP